MHKAIAFAVLALLITGCATPAANYVPSTTSFSRPPLHTQATAAVGEEMLSQGNSTERAGIDLRSQVQVGGFTLSPGFYPLAGRNNQGSFYQFQYMSATRAGYGVLSKNFLADEPQAVMTTDVPTQMCVVTILNVKTCGTGSYRASMRREESDNNFQQTLIYSGRVGNQVRLSYREFSGSMARPAFNNDVEYDLSASNEIAYRGARIRIIEANNTQITYEVISNFNTPQAR